MIKEINADIQACCSVGNDMGFEFVRFFFPCSEGLQSDPLLLNTQYRTTILSTHIFQTLRLRHFFCINYITDLL